MSDSPVSSTGWAVLLETTNREEALVIMGLLQAANVVCRLGQDTMARYYGVNVGDLGTLRIEVLPDQLEAAQAILNAPFDATELPDPEDE